MKRFILLTAFVSLIIGNAAAADTHEELMAKTGDQHSFIRKIGRPVSIASLNPLPGFMDALMEMDAETGFIKQPESGWQPFQEADVWVFFMEKHEELGLMGFYFDQIKTLINFDETSVSHTAYVTIGSQSRSVLVSYNFLSNYREEDQNVDILACKVAASLYRGLKGASDEEGNAIAQKCIEAK